MSIAKAKDKILLLGIGDKMIDIKKEDEVLNLIFFLSVHPRCGDIN